MGLDIRSKNGLHLRMGYGDFHWMRGEVLETMHRGFGTFYEWSTAGYSGNLWGIKCNYTEATEDEGRVYDFPFDIRPAAFSSTCNELLGTWMKENGFSFAWRHFFCHSDFGGKLTASQCKRLIKDLDRMPSPSKYGIVFAAFYRIVCKAAEQNETLYFS